MYQWRRQAVVGVLESTGETLHTVANRPYRSLCVRACVRLFLTICADCMTTVDPFPGEAALTVASEAPTRKPTLAVWLRNRQVQAESQRCTQQTAKNKQHASTTSCVELSHTLSRSPPPTPQQAAYLYYCTKASYRRWRRNEKRHIKNKLTWKYHRHSLSWEPFGRMWQILVLGVRQS